MKTQKFISRFLYIFYAGLIFFAFPVFSQTSNIVIDGYSSDWNATGQVWRDTPGDANMTTDCRDLDSIKTFLDVVSSALYVAVWQQTCTHSGIYLLFDTDKNISTGISQTSVTQMGSGFPGTDITAWIGTGNTGLRDFTLHDWQDKILPISPHQTSFILGNESFFEAKFNLTSLAVSLSNGFYLYISNGNDVFPNNHAAIEIKSTGISIVYPFGAQVAGKILSPSGSPVIGAFVYPVPATSDAIMYFDQNTYSGISDAQGNYILSCIPNGSYYIQARKKGSAPTMLGDVFDPLTAVVLQIGATSNYTQKDIHLQPGASISGRVINKATGLVVAKKGSSCVMKVDSMFSDGFAKSWHLGDFDIDSTGNFTMPDLPPGQYGFNPHIDGWYSDTNIYVTVSQGQNLTGVNIPLKRGAIISGTITSGASPVSLMGINFSIQAISTDTTNSMMSNSHGLMAISTKDSTGTTTDIPGKYKVTDMVAGTYYLLLNSSYTDGIEPSPYGPALLPQGLDFSHAQQITIKAGDSLTNVNFSLAPATMIEGYVKDQSGNPVAFANVGLSIVYNGKIISLSSVNADASGHYMLNAGLGSFYLNVEADLNSMHYNSQWYGDPQNTGDWETATPITLDVSRVPATVDITLNPNIMGENSTCYDNMGNPYPCDGSSNNSDIKLEITKAASGAANLAISFDTTMFKIDTFSIMRGTLNSSGRGWDNKVIARVKSSGGQYAYTDNTVDNTKCYYYKVIGYGTDIISSDYSIFNESNVFDTVSSLKINLEAYPFWGGIEISWTLSVGKNDMLQSQISNQVLIIEKTGDRPDTMHVGQDESHFAKSLDYEDIGTTYKIKAIAYDKSGSVFAQSDDIIFIADASKFPYIANMKTLAVGLGKQYSTIQAAIDAADNFSKIIIYPKDASNSPYAGRISTKGKVVVLSGDVSNGKLPVIDAAGDTGIFLSFTGQFFNEHAGASVENLRIQNAKVGIHNYGMARVFNCQIINCAIGIWTMPSVSDVKTAVRTLPIMDLSFGAEFSCLTMVGGGAATQASAIIMGPADSVPDPAWGAEPPRMNFGGTIDRTIITNFGYGAIMTGEGGMMVKGSVFYNNTLNLWTPSTSAMYFPFDTINISTQNPVFLTDGSWLLAKTSPFYSDSGSMPGASPFNRNGDNEIRFPTVKGLVMMPGNNKVSLKWNKIAADAIPYYQGKINYWVLRMPGDSSLYTDINGQWDFKEGKGDSVFNKYMTALDTITDTFFTDNTPKNGTSYIYFVIAMDSLSGSSGKPDFSSANPISYYTVMPFGPALFTSKIRGSSVSFVIDAGTIPAKVQSSNIMRFAFNSGKWDTVRTVKVQKHFYPLTDGNYTADFELWRGTDLIQKDKKTVSVLNLKKIVPARRWNLVSVPSKSTIPIVKPVNLETSPLEVFYWDGTSVPTTMSQYYIGLDKLTALEQGKGYWWRDEKEDTLKMTFSDRVTKGDVPMLALSEKGTGWNQIASPFIYPINISGLGLQVWGLKFNAVDSTVSYDTTSVLNPWEGYWVNVTSASVFTLDTVIAPILDSPAVAAKEVAPTENKWSLKISTKSGGFADRVNYFGIDPSAENGPDRLDLIEPPVFDGALSLYFTHKDWKNTSTRYAADIRKELNSSGGSKIGVFGFTIENSSSQVAADIWLEGLNKVPSNFYVGIIDMGKVYDMRENSNLKVSGKQGKRSYYAVITDNKDLLMAFGGKITMSQNYPNPFNPATVITYTVPYEFKSDGTLTGMQREINLNVYSRDGRLVKKLDSGIKDPGCHKVRFDGLGNNNKPLSSGMYFYKLKIGASEQIRKMILLK